MQWRKVFAGLFGPAVIMLFAISIMNVGFLKSNEKPVKELVLEVSYTGPWKGKVFNNGDIQKVSGFSAKTIHVYRLSDGEWIVSFQVEKLDGSTNLLLATIRSTDGISLDKDFSIEPYGMVLLTVEITSNG